MSSCHTLYTLYQLSQTICIQLPVGEAVGELVRSHPGDKSDHLKHNEIFLRCLVFTIRLKSTI